jgi:hypothetical protein
VYMEGESSTLETPAAITDQDGVASQAVRGSDTVSIYSGMPALEFDPITAAGNTLSAAGMIDIAARRLVEASKLCRFLSAANHETLAFHFTSLGEQSMEVAQGNPINVLRGANQYLTPTQPLAVFQPGQGLFTVALSEFAAATAPGQCISGGWYLLGSELTFDCAAGEIQPDIPICEARAAIPCAEFSSTSSQFVKNRALKYIARARRLERRLAKQYPDMARNVSFVKRVRHSFKRLDAVLTQAEGVAGGCSAFNPVCRQVEFPKDDLRRALNRAFDRRPKRGRKLYRAMRKRIKAEFEADLEGIPDALVQCE